MVEITPILCIGVGLLLIPAAVLASVNQDGTSQSSPTTSYTPYTLFNGMSLLDAWPPGFVNQSDQLLFFGAVWENLTNSVWLIPYNSPAVVKFPFQNLTSPNAFSQFPSGIVSTGVEKFEGASFDGHGSIWLTPLNADQMVQINVVTGAMTGHNSWPGTLAQLSIGNKAFSSSAYDGAFVWIAPLNADRVVKVSVADGTMTGVNSWPADYVRPATGLAFRSVVFDGQKMFFLPYQADRIVSIASSGDTGMGSYKAWPPGLSSVVLPGFFASGASLGNNRILLAPFDANFVVLCNTNTGTMTSYSQWPEGFSLEKGAFLSAIFDGSSVWLIPFRANALIKVDVAGGYVMSMYNSWPKRSDSLQCCNHHYAGAARVDTTIFVAPFAAANVLTIALGEPTLAPTPAPTEAPTPLPSGETYAPTVPPTTDVPTPLPSGETHKPTNGSQPPAAGSPGAGGGGGEPQQSSPSLPSSSVKASCANLVVLVFVGLLMMVVL